ERLVDHQLDVDGTHEPVALVAGVGPGRVAQLAPQGVADVAELVVVARREVDREVVGCDRRAADADRDMVVHLPGEAAGQFDGADARPEGACERTFDHALQSPFEATDCHGMGGYRYAARISRRRAPGRPPPGRWAGGGRWRRRGPGPP